MIDVPVPVAMLSMLALSPIVRVSEKNAVPSKALPLSSNRSQISSPGRRAAASASLILRL
ncbi:MAG: hypothetical protein IIB87_05575 [Chloroflexi bacterium]|nr:hypothetical protein [Chloroflexota bacterium]